LWGIDFSQTAPRARPDEETFIAEAFAYFRGDRGLEILRTGWPEGFFRLVHSLEWLEAVILRVLWGRPVHMACLYAVHPLAVQLWPRVFSALIDVGSCLLVGLTARRLARTEERAWALSLGILALGCNYLVARDAHFGVSDATMLFTLCLALYALVRAVTERPEFLVLAGAAVGMGFGIKYAAVPWVVACLVAFYVCLRRFPRPRRTLVIGLLSLLGAVFTFGWVSPNALPHFGVFFAELANHAGRYGADGRGYRIDPEFAVPAGWRYYLGDILPTAFGGWGFVFSLVGVGLCWRRDRGVGLVLATAAFAAFTALVNLQALFARYAQPMIPPLAVGLGLCLATACAAAVQRRSAPRMFGAALLVVLALGIPAARTVELDRLLSAPDTRDQASRWLLEHGGGPTVSQGWYTEVHLLDPESLEACRGQVPPWLWREVPTTPACANDWKEWMHKGQGAWGQMAHHVVDVGRWSIRPREGARYVVAGQGLLTCGRFARNGRDLPLGPPCYQLVASFSPGIQDCHGSMDVFDAMWVPFRGFGGQRFPGPRLDIYENHCRTSYLPLPDESAVTPSLHEESANTKGPWALALREWRELPDGGWNDAGGLGQPQSEKLVATTNADGGLEVFYLSKDVILHDWQVDPGGDWHGKELLHGLARDLAVARNTDGRLEVLTIGTDDKVYRHVQATPGGAWLPESALGGLGLRIAMAKNADGRLEVFYVGTDHRLYHNWESNLDGGWAGENRFEGSAQDLSVATDAEGHLNVVYVGDDQRIRENHQRGPNNRWNGERSLQTLGLKVALAQASGSTMQAFILDPDFQILNTQRLSGDSGWTVPRPMGAAALQIAAGTDSRSRVQVVYLGTDFKLHHDWETGPGEWHGPVNLGVRAGGGIFLASGASGLLELFFLGPR
jgi:hypothetical protein